MKGRKIRIGLTLSGKLLIEAVDLGDPQQQGRRFANVPTLRFAGPMTKLAEGGSAIAKP